MIMNRRLQLIVAISILVIVLLLKWYLVSQTPFPSYDSFYGIRQVDHIKETGLPLFSDTQSFQGRTHIVSVLFFYFFTLLSIFLPVLLMFKYAGIILSLIALLLLFILAKKLYTKKWIPLFVLFLGALTPTIFLADVNKLVPSSLFMIIYLAMIYMFFNLDKKNAVFGFILLLVLGTLISSLSVVVILGLTLYLLLLRVEKIPVRRLEREILFFSSMFVIWYHLIIYKKLFYLYGIQAVWESIPKEIFLNQFQGLTIPLAVGLIGIIPLLLGLYAIYDTLFSQRRRHLVLLVSFSLVFGILTWMRILPLQEGLLYATITLTLLSGHTLQSIQIYLKKTIIPKAAYILTGIFIVIIVLSFLPTVLSNNYILSNSPTVNEYSTLEALQYLSANETILGHIQEGHLIASVAKTKNFYDSNFLFAPNANERYDDAHIMFLSKSQIPVIELMKYYNINYIYISPLTEKQYDYPNFIYETSDCFSLIYSTTTTKVYKLTCQ